MLGIFRGIVGLGMSAALTPLRAMLQARKFRAPVGLAEDLPGPRRERHAEPPPLHGLCAEDYRA